MIAYQVPSETDPEVLLQRRLLTTLLDPEHAPVLELVLCYHERWEIELTTKELFERYPFLQARFSSFTPAGVLQEFSGSSWGPTFFPPVFPAKDEPERFSLIFSRLSLKKMGFLSHLRRFD